MSDRTVETGLTRLSNFVNVGLAFISAIFVFQFAFGGREVLPAALVNPSLGYGIAFAVACFAVFRSGRINKSYAFETDALPTTVFALASLLAGVRGTWLWLLLAIALVAPMVVSAVEKRTERDES